MFAVVLLGLAIFGFFLYLATLFFQLHAMQTKLENCLRNSEVFLLKQFGEVPQSDEQDEDQ